MKSKTRITLALIGVLALSGCVSREQADAKLAKACEAAVNVFLGEGQRIDKIKDASFTASPIGPDMRHVTIHTIMMDGWLEAENDYECVFEEGFGFLNSGYTASISEEGEGHVKFDVDAGELVLGTAPQDGRTLVRGSTSRLHHELSQFLTTLAPPEEVRQNLVGPGASGAG